MRLLYSGSIYGILTTVFERINKSAIRSTIPFFYEGRKFLEFKINPFVCFWYWAFTLIIGPSLRRHPHVRIYLEKKCKEFSFKYLNLPIGSLSENHVESLMVSDNSFCVTSCPCLFKSNNGPLIRKSSSDINRENLSRRSLKFISWTNRINKGFL